MNINIENNFLEESKHNVNTYNLEKLTKNRRNG